MSSEALDFSPHIHTPLSLRSILSLAFHLGFSSSCFLFSESPIKIHAILFSPYSCYLSSLFSFCGETTKMNEESEGFSPQLFTCYENSVSWSQLDEVKVQWQAAVSTAVNFLVPKKAGTFLAS
jgi:hypothetical protein